MLHPHINTDDYSSSDWKVEELKSVIIQKDNEIFKLNEELSKLREENDRLNNGIENLYNKYKNNVKD